MIYLRDNPLLRRPLRPKDFKNRLLEHWGSEPPDFVFWLPPGIRTPLHASVLVEAVQQQLNLLHAANAHEWTALDRTELLLAPVRFGEMAHDFTPRYACR
jgi:hypothetical protein